MNEPSPPSGPIVPPGRTADPAVARDGPGPLADPAVARDGPAPLAGRGVDAADSHGAPVPERGRGVEPADASGPPAFELGQRDEPARAHGPPAPVLVAGAGNIFLGDDGFGCEVVARLGERDLPEGVEVRDYGIGGLHLAYDLLEGHRTLLLVDTIARGAEPGSLCLLEVGEQDLAEGVLETHGMDPATVLATLRTLGGRMPRTLVLGCEPAEVVERIGLSTPVGAAVEAALDAVVDVVLDELAAPPGTRATDVGTRAPDAGAGEP